MRTRLWGNGAGAIRVVVCASALCAAAAGAFADEYRPEDNACCFDERAPDETLPALAFLGLGTALGLTMAAYTNRSPSHPPFLRPVAAGYRGFSEREARISPPRLSR